MEDGRKADRSESIFEACCTEISRSISESTVYGVAYSRAANVVSCDLILSHATLPRHVMPHVRALSTARNSECAPRTPARSRAGARHSHNGNASVTIILILIHRATCIHPFPRRRRRGGRKRPRHRRLTFRPVQLFSAVATVPPQPPANSQKLSGCASRQLFRLLYLCTCLPVIYHNLL